MTGYLYQGDPWLETANQAIMDARPPGTGNARLGDEPEPVCRNNHPYGDAPRRADGTRRCRTCRDATKRRKETT